MRENYPRANFAFAVSFATRKDA